MATAKHYAHLTLEMRREIENGVVEGRSPAWMAEGLGVDATSVSRELRRNRSLRNDCAHRKACARRRICDPDCRRKCSSCARMCGEAGCADYERQRCGRTHRAPWACNGCERRPTCPLEQFAYSARMAQAKADERLAESRRGLDMTGCEMAFLAREVKAGPAKGQSVHHVFASRDDLPRSERSFYRHVENEDIDVAKMDLRKKVRYKRRGGKRASRREAAFYEGRTYADYLAPGEGERERSRWTAWRAPRGTPRPCSRSTSSRSGSRPTSCSGGTTAPTSSPPRTGWRASWADPRPSAGSSGSS